MEKCLSKKLITFLNVVIRACWSHDSLDRRVKILVLSIDDLHLRGSNGGGHENRSGTRVSVLLLLLILGMMMLFVMMTMVIVVVLVIGTWWRNDAHRGYTASVNGSLGTDSFDSFAALEIARLRVLELGAGSAGTGRTRSGLDGRRGRIVPAVR